MSADEVFAWELAKENVIPVSRGRNVDKLNVALAHVHSTSFQSTLNKMETDHESRIASYTGDDPIKPWLDYYKWAQENFPSDTKKILSILSRATDTFKSSRKYRNDIRYLKLWVAFADKAEKPFEMFNFLYKSKIGDKLALFYIAWAFLSEKRGKIKDAEAIFNRGFLKKAEPREVLKKKHEEFNQRISKKWTNDSENSESDGSQQSVWTAKTLGDTAKSNERLPKTSTPSPLANMTNTLLDQKAKATLTILTERKAVNRTPFSGSGSIDRVVSAGESIRKPVTPGVACSRQESSSTQKDNNVPVFVDGSSRKRPHSTIESDSQILKVKSDIYRFKKELLFDSDGNEFCFEEVRARRFLSRPQLRSENILLLNSSQSIKSYDVEISKSSREVFQDLQQASNEDITINTKLALEDINSMFQSPQKTPVSTQGVKVPRTEEPIIRKLQFQSFGADDIELSAQEADEAETRIQICDEENKTAFKKPTVVSDIIRGPAKLTYKDILQSSFSRSEMYIGDVIYETTCVIDPYEYNHRRELIQSRHVAQTLCAMHDTVFVYKMQLKATFLASHGKQNQKFKKKTFININSASQCEILGCLGSGAYASVFAGRMSTRASCIMPNSLAIKLELGVDVLPWEYYSIREIDRRADQQSLNERNLVKAHSLHVYENAVLMLLQRGNRGTLHDLVNAYKKLGRSVPENIVLVYTRQMFQSLVHVHASGFLHGDIKPDNWILVRGAPLEESNDIFDSGRICLIDFGRAIDLQLYPSNATFCGNMHAEGFKCIEMRTKRPWLHQIDTFGLCATVHFLLFGDYMEITCEKTGGAGDVCSQKWSMKKALRRYWQTDFWREFFDTFLNISDCQNQPNLSHWGRKISILLKEDPSRLRETCRLLRIQDETILQAPSF
ncbi:hypothetical protein LEN26_006839 [Aphanomyces euteiches]|nr:hypothetical protein AeMF1_010044 [Aphanomyces euteiches]KAH9134210.1 hypothetical protein LEN26_006839 [Aphanomyces euteiches]KAH9190082.1 hypothetical protein AeNC1_007945 [Aphanomyces euteiches]